MAWFEKKYVSGGPTEEDILKHTTYLQWRTSLTIERLVNESRTKMGLVIYGNNQGTYYPNLRSLESQGLLVGKWTTDMTDGEIETTDDETINTREKIEALLRKRNGSPSRIYKKNPSGILTRDKAPLIALPESALVTREIHLT